MNLHLRSKGEMTLADLGSLLAELIIEARAETTDGHIDVLIGGAATIGKTRLAEELSDRLSSMLNQAVTLVNLDSFMYDRSVRIAQRLSGYSAAAYNWPEIESVGHQLCDGRHVTLHPYSHLTGRHGDACTIGGSPMIIYEGAIALNIRGLCSGPKVSIFLTASPPTMVYLRVREEFSVRKYPALRIIGTLNSEMREYRKNVKPMQKPSQMVVHVSSRRKYHIATSR